MVANINNFGVVNFYESSSTRQESAQKAEPVCEDVTPVPSDAPVDSVIFTKKAAHWEKPVDELGKNSNETI